jgi:hypothetical protein
MKSRSPSNGPFPARTHSQNTDEHAGMDTYCKKNGWLLGNNFPVTLIVAAVWLLVIVTSMAFILRYSNTPGRTGVTPIHWPMGGHIALAVNRPTLIMFAHPHCPCTRATIGELEKLMANCQGRLSAQVWFIKPAGTSEDWTDTDLWHTASAIPGVTVHRDDDGLEARRFQAETSGQTLLYNPDGQLLFQGGITISRGHAGDNPGSSALEALLNHKLTSQVQTPVFGCSLFANHCQQGQGGVLCKQ